MPIWTVESPATLCPLAVEWLWPGALARGKVAVFDGDPEIGKSLVTLDLAARLTRGGPLPCGAPLHRPGTAILLSAEDDVADTVMPRAEAAGADLSRLVLPRFPGAVPRFPHDLGELEALIRERSADLVVIDPLMAFLPPQVAANLDQSIRQVTTPLAMLAARTGSAVLLVRHLTKRGSDRAIYRGQGSVGILAAARTAWLAAPHPTDPDARVWSVLKTNVSRRPRPLAFRVAETASGRPRIEWTGPVDYSADELLRPAKPTTTKPRDRATDWLKKALADGPKPAADLFAAAAAVGIPEITLRRGKKELPAQSHRCYDYDRERGEWYWYDPDADWPEDAPFEKPYELPPLPPLGG